MCLCVCPRYRQCLSNLFAGVNCVRPSNLFMCKCCLFVSGVDCLRARVAEPEKMERHATSPISYVLALDNSKLHNYTLITKLYSNTLRLMPYSDMSKTIWYTVIMNRHTV